MLHQDSFNLNLIFSMILNFPQIHFDNILKALLFKMVSHFSDVLTIKEGKAKHK